MPAAIDLFCGMGGLGWGFANSGFDVKGYDIDPHAIRTYKTNVAAAEKVDLLRDELVEECDLIIGGPPCEPWSSLNVTKRGRQHPLSKCISSFYRIVRKSKPLVFVMENVTQLKHDPQFQKELEVTSESGYFIRYFTIKYSNYGCATSRRRLFTLGIHSRLNTSPSEVLQMLRRQKPATVKQAIWDLRKVERSIELDHVWPLARTADKYAHMYNSGKYGWYVLKWDSPAPSFGNITKTYILHPGYLDGGPKRPISVREAMRIMGFKDRYTFPRDVPLSRKYEMVAEAVPPQFSSMLATSILRILGNDK